MAIRVPINLASQPFRRDRPALVGLTAVAVAAALLLLFQVARIVSERHQAADMLVTIDRLSAQVRTIDAEQAKLNA
ncbi:MAG TPA: hypothetical protein VLW25_12045, partial [Bryobacteraceae bacterium]|nr:hypothetical protein [Bryobacteraceae bacterium]